MIYNERQYKITTAELEKFKKALDEFIAGDSPEWLVKTQKQALEHQIKQLAAEIKEYELLKSGKLNYSECTSLEQLPIVLIKSRISQGYLQKDLARALGISEQQVQRYEASGYKGASLSRLIEIADILQVNITESWSGHCSSEGDFVYSWSDIGNVDWLKFPYKEMIQRGWLNIKEDKPIDECIKEYFIENTLQSGVSAFHRKKFHGENRPKQYSLFAWQINIFKKANQVIQNHGEREFNHKENWMGDLVKLSRKKNFIKPVREMLLENGIILLFEKHLDGTYLDGAAMLHDCGMPIVALTLRYDRIDHFWFVLMHELGHVYRHLFENYNLDFFDEESDESVDVIEKEADFFAQNNLIPVAEWSNCLSRFFHTNENIIDDARRLKINPAIIAGRIRKETGKWHLFNDLLGKNELRRQVYNDD